VHSGAAAYALTQNGMPAELSDELSLWFFYFFIFLFFYFFIFLFFSMQHPEPVLLDSRCGGLCNRQLVLDKTVFTPKKAAMAKARKTAETESVTSIISQALSAGIPSEDLTEAFVAKKRKAALARLSMRSKKQALTSVGSPSRPVQSAAMSFEA